MSLKKAYKNILINASNIVPKIEKLKFFFAEWYAIYKKKPLYKNVKWTAEQQKEFDAYWKENYGKKISNRWHKLYEACSGVHCIEYFPEILFSTKYEFMVNDYAYADFFANKNLLGLFFDGRIDCARTPKCYVCNANGNYYDSEKHLISDIDARNIAKDIGRVIIKPTVDSSSGKNVCIIDIHNGIDKRSGRSIENIMSQYGQNFVIQECIKPCSELKSIYPNSINTLRVISYIVDGKINVAPVSLRIGGNGSEVDNIHAGGMSIDINNEGVLGKFAYRLGYGDSFEKYDKHPDTGFVFEGYKFEFYDKLISTAKRLHEMTVNLGIISWDFTVDDKGNIVVVEANCKGQSVWFAQMLSGKAFFGKDTRKVLQKISKKGNKK